jgi:hypothetical protein
VNDRFGARLEMNGGYEAISRTSLHGSELPNDNYTKCRLAAVRFFSAQQLSPTRELYTGVPAGNIAKQCDTSIAMIDRYYSYVIVLTSARDVSGGAKTQETLNE